MISFFIDWSNQNQGFLSAIFAFTALLASVVAIWVAINTARKQNRIALYEKRVAVFNELIKIQTLVGFLKSDYLNSITDNEAKNTHYVHLIADIIGCSYEEFVSSSRKTAIVMNFIFQMSIVLAQASDLYPTPYSTHIKEIFKHYKSFVWNAVLNLPACDTNAKDLVSSVESFLQDDSPRMKKIDRMNRL